MPTITPYTERYSPEGSLNTRADGSAGAQIGAAVQNIGEAGMGLAQTMQRNADIAYKNEVANETTVAHRLGSQKHLEFEQALINRSNSAVPGDTTFASTFIADTRKDLEEAGKQFKTARAQEVFNALSDRIVSSFGARAIHLQANLTGKAVTQDFDKTIDAESKIVNGNEKNYDSSLKRVFGMIGDRSTLYAGVDEATRNSLKDLAKSKLATSTVEGVFARDIFGAARKLVPDLVAQSYGDATHLPSIPGRSGGSTFDSVMKFIFKEEGGYNAKDGNSGKPVNFGINQRANPDVDVKNLTKEGAAQIYMDRYWKAIGGDNISPNMATVAMNAAVNMGTDAAKELMAKSGGDPAAFTELVKQRYQAIAKNDPAQAKYLGGWLARADRALAASEVSLDVQGQPIPQLKIPKDAALAPPQGVDIPGWNDLSLDAQQKFMSKLVTDFNSRVTVDRATLIDDRKNMTANLLAGNSYSNMASLQAKYSAAYGPDMASRMIKEDAINADLGQFSKSIKGRSMAEITTAMGMPPADNSSADEYAAWKQKVALVEADRKELASSPVNYVMRYSAPVNQAAMLMESARAEAERTGSPDAINRATAETQKFITASLAEQRRLGVASPAILSEAEEKRLTQKIEEISGSGRDVAQGIDALYKSYGSYGPTVAAQMAPKIGGFMNILGSGIDQNSAAMLVEGNRNREQLKKVLPEEKIKGIADTVRLAMAEYSASMTADPNNARVQATYQDQIEVLAMMRMSKNGESQTEAVQKAYKSLVGDLYTFQDGYRVPVGLDAKAIRNQAIMIRNGLSANDVAPLPGSLGNPVDRMNAQLSSYRAYGRWVTASSKGPDGKMEEGLMFVVPTIGGGGYEAVTAVDGKPLFRSFGQLILEYQSARIETSQDALARGDMRQYERLSAKERYDARRIADERMVDEQRAFRAKKQGLIP